MHASRRSRRRSRLRVPTRTPSTRCSTGYGWLGGTPRSASTASSGAPSRLPSFVRMTCVCHNRNLGSSSVPPPLPALHPSPPCGLRGAARSSHRHPFSVSRAQHSFSPCGPDGPCICVWESKTDMSVDEFKKFVDPPDGKPPPHGSRYRTAQA